MSNPQKDPIKSWISPGMLAREGRGLRHPDSASDCQQRARQAQGPGHRRSGEFLKRLFMVVAYSLSSLLFRSILFMVVVYSLLSLLFRSILLR